MSTSHYKVSNGIEISSSDDRIYHTFQLDNSLQVVVISDPSSEKSSAALDVHVGHLSDPVTLPGLAHFCEHMLFLGTEKYPDENAYSQFLSAHGGSSNAFTSMTDTNYYFDVTSAHFTSALDYFAQFFIAPLFTASATDREMNAVDSENAKNLQNDYWRFNQLYKHFANKEHAFHKFGTGNLTTLSTRPKEEGIDVREALLAFHTEYYSASIMKLVLYGKESVEELESIARNLFSTIRNTKREAPRIMDCPFTSNQLGYRVHVAPVKDLNLIEAVWPVLSQRSAYLQKPHRYLSHLIGHEGAGSLLSELKRKGYANEISAGLSKDEKEWAMFSITVDATDEGIAHVDEVVSAMYAYIAMLKSNAPEKWIFTETQEIAQMNFRFRNKERPINYTSTLAGRMHKFPMHHILTGIHLLSEFIPEQVTTLLNAFQPHLMRLTVVSKTFDGKTESVEPWYSTPYSEMALSSELMTLWSKSSDNVTNTVFTLPEVNDLISTNFELVESLKKNLLSEIEMDTEKKESFSKVPEIVLDTPGARCWYKLDSVFRKPKLSFLLHIVTPKAYGNIVDSVLTDLYIRYVNDALTESVYDAELAGMKYVLSHSIKGIEIYLSGYHHKLPQLATRVLSSLLSTADIITTDIYNRVFAKAARDYANFSQEQPYQHAIYDSSYLVETPRWRHEEKLDVMTNGNCITEKALQDHGKALFSTLFLEALVHGNVLAKDAVCMMKNALDSLRSPSPLPLSQVPALRVVHLEAQCDYIYQADEPNLENNNSAIQCIYQIGPHSITSIATIDLLAHMMKEPCFNQLRTQEQLGYIVFSGVYRTHGIDFFRIIIQSDKMAADGLHARINAFIASFETSLQETDTETFEKFKQAVCEKYLEKPKTPWEESMRFWPRITSWDYDFSRRQQVADSVKTLHLNDVTTLFTKYIAKEGSHRACLSVQLFGNNHCLPTPPCTASSSTDNGMLMSPKDQVANLAALALEKDKKKTCIIKNMDAFKRRMPLFAAQGNPMEESLTQGRL